jgi:hypothetical protein
MSTRFAPRVCSGNTGSTVLPASVTTWTSRRALERCV